MIFHATHSFLILQFDGGFQNAMLQIVRITQTIWAHGQFREYESALLKIIKYIVYYFSDNIST